LKAECNSDVSPPAELTESVGQHVTHNGGERSLNSTRQNLFTVLKSEFVNNMLPSDTKHLTLPKPEHKHTTETTTNADTHRPVQTNCCFTSSINVQSILVKLPLIARLQRIKCEIPASCIKTEVADAVYEEAKASADAETTNEADIDVKKETSAAEKSQQLARETIANICGTDAQPPTLMKIPMKRKRERDRDERTDTKHSRSRYDTVRDGSPDRQHSWYVLKQLHSGDNRGFIPTYVYCLLVGCPMWISRAAKSANLICWHFFLAGSGFTVSAELFCSNSTNLH